MGRWIIGESLVLVANFGDVLSLGWDTLRWRHNERDGVSNHQPHHCLLKRLFRRRSKKPSKPRVTGLCEGNSPGTGDFPAQRASNAANVSIWWRHHEILYKPCIGYVAWWPLIVVPARLCKFIGTQLMIGWSLIKSMGSRFPNEIQWHKRCDLKLGNHGNISSYGNMPEYILLLHLLCLVLVKFQRVFLSMFVFRDFVCLVLFL